MARPVKFYIRIPFDPDPTSRTISYRNTGEMTQWIKLLTPKPNDPSSIPGTYTVDGTEPICASCFLISAYTYMQSHTHINRKRIEKEYINTSIYLKYSL